MLEHNGAFGIDADSFSHRAIAKGAPGYQQVINTFGRWIIGADGEIDRARLGRLVFSDPEALRQLEAIVHPLVLQAVDWMVQRSNKPVIVIEAIKLLESNLRSACDSIWVVTVPPDVQVTRLVQKRKMSEVEARQRIAAQGPQEQKLAVANVVINNSGSFEETWKQVMAAWQKIGQPAEPVEPAPVEKTQTVAGAVSVSRAKPRDAEHLAGLNNRINKDKPVTANDIMAEFGDKAFLLVRAGDRVVGSAGWQVENLVSRMADIVLDPVVPAAQVLPPLIDAMERYSRDLQCEASLVFAAPDLSVDSLWQGVGYERRTPQSLGVAVWQEAARETLQPGQVLYFKQLRQDRVLRPI